MMKRSLSCIGILLILSYFAEIQAQTSCISAVGAIYGSPTSNERGKCLLPTPGGDGLYAVGMKEDSVLIVRLDLMGQIIWARAFDIIPGVVDNVSSAIIDGEGMILTEGIAGDYTEGGNIFAFRYDPIANQILWAKEYVNSTMRSYTFPVTQTINGDYLLGCNPFPPVPGVISDSELLQVSKANGNPVSGLDKVYNLGGSEEFTELVLYQGFMYGCGRYTDGDPSSKMRHTIMKIDPATLNQVWVKCGYVPQSGTARLYARDMIIDADLIYTVGLGDPAGTSSTNTKQFLQKTDINGNLIWVKQYDLPGSNHWGHQIIKSGGGLVVLAGKLAAPSNIFLYKTNLDGAMLWGKQFQFSPSIITAIQVDRGNSQLIEVGNNLFLTATGVTTDGSTDILIFRMDLDGNMDMPCVTSVPLSIPVIPVPNPVFYSVNPTTSNGSQSVNTETPDIIETPFTYREECVIPETLFGFVDTIICSGDSYEGYTQTGTYTDNFFTSEGCDSIRTVELTVNVCDTICPMLIGAVYGTSGDDEYGYSLAATPGNDGFYAAGRREDWALIVKMNMAGEIIWSRTFDIIPDATDHVGTVIVDSDGNLVLAGTAGDADLGGTIFACRYNPNSNQVLWAKEYITELTSERCFTLVQKDNGGNYILSSNPNDVPNSNNDATLLEIDKNSGNINPAFAKQYHLGGSESINEIVLKDQFIYGAGRYNDGPDPAQMRNTLVKIDPVSGHHVWVRLGHRDGDATARLYGFDLVIKGNDIYSGYHGDPAGTSTTNTKLFLQKTSLDGNLLWLKQYDLPGNTDFGFEIIESNNGMVVLAENRATPRQIFMFKINLSGDVEWAKTYSLSVLSNSDTYYYGRNQLIQIGDQLLFTGYGSSIDNRSEMLVVRTDLNGEVLNPCVISENINIGVTNVSNPVFYSVDLVESDAVHDTKSYQPTPADFPIEPNDLCIIVDTLFTYIDAAICEGQEYEGYTETGVYEDYFTASIGCDSLRTLSLTVIDCQSILYYSLNACTSYMSNGSNMDYSEFIPEYPTGVGCANVTATNLFRTPPQENKHSCTPGANSSIGMCISALPGCTYMPGHQASLVTEINFNPTGDSIVRLTKFEFYERSPNMYNWINGGSGPNNYPRFYGIRVLKDGQEIYRMENIATHLNWTLQSFDFSSIPEFDIDQPAVIRIEILPYCPIGNGATVSAWDIDEVNLFGGCLPSTGNSPFIAGTIKTESGKVVPGATISLGKYASFIPAQHSASNSDGEYLFNAVDKGWKYYIKGSKNDQWLQGVNTMDLLRLQKHLLGIERFTSITQYVAADVNHNGTINVTDLLDLRKALLGIYSSFPYNTSWRIGIRNDLPISSYSAFDVVNKLPPAIPQPLIFDFLGVKIGDVNQDIDPDIKQDDLISRSSDVFDLKTDEIVFQGGSEIAVPIIADGDIQLEGLQLMMASHQLELVSIQPGKIPMLPEYYAYSAAGIISISWSQVEPISISKGDVLFTIIFSTQKPGALSQEIDLLQTTLLPEVYSQNETKSVKLSFDSYLQEKQGECISHVSVEPNPFTVSSTIHFHLKELSKVRFVFYDLTGQMLYEEEHEYLPGMQSLLVDNEKLQGGEGLIYCQMMTDDQVITKKLVKIR